MCLRDLLMSSPDEYSPLNGTELVAATVRRIVFQGGWYEPLHEDGHGTFNWDCGGPWVEPDTGCTNATQYVIQNLPESVELIYSDMGDEVAHGAALAECAPAESPCREAYRLYPAGSTPAILDPIVVVVAVHGHPAFSAISRREGMQSRDSHGANHGPTELNDTAEPVCFRRSLPVMRSRHGKRLARSTALQLDRGRRRRQTQVRERRAKGSGVWESDALSSQLLS